MLAVTMMHMNLLQEHLPPRSLDRPEPSFSLEDTFTILLVFTVTMSALAIGLFLARHL